MATAYILYNEKAGNENSIQSAMALKSGIADKTIFTEISSISNYRNFFAFLDKDDYIIIAGGDGTLNRFINDTEGIDFDNKVLYFPNGTGNDFAHDLGYCKECKPFDVTSYIKGLPYVTVKEKTCRFINGIGYGIDGYCCEVGDKLKKIPGKKINYSAIAIKGLLFHFKPTRAKVTVDGKVYTYEKVWIAPTMHGRFYGGGMMPTPDQQRNSGKLSTMIFHGSGKLKTLMIFPSLFKGAHVKHTKYISILTGNDISVEFDRPVALQIDGETVLEVSSYSVKACQAVENKEERLLENAEFYTSDK